MEHANHTLRAVGYVRGKALSCRKIMITDDDNVLPGPTHLLFTNMHVYWTNRKRSLPVVSIINESLS